MDIAWRPTAQAAIHPVGSAQSFCVSTRHHTDITHTHACGSGHRFCVSAWHHTDVTQRHTLFTAVHTHIQTHIHIRLRTQLLHEHLAPHRHTHTRLRTQLLRECLAPHRHTHTLHSSAHSHSGPSRSPGRWAMERHPLQPPCPMLSANPTAEPEPPEDAASG